MLLCNHLLHSNTVNCTIPPKRKKTNKTKTPKHNKQRFKIDSVWLQVALSVYSKPEEIKSCITSFCCSLSLTLSQFRVFSVYVCVCVSGGQSIAFLSGCQAAASRQHWRKRSNSHLPDRERVLA